MKSLLTFLTLLLLSTMPLLAQVAQERSVIAAGGEQFNAGNLSLSWTLGEPVTETYTASGLTVSQGFQQGELNLTGTHDNRIPYQVEVFPNPTSQTLFVTATDADRPLVAELVGLNGAVLRSQVLSLPIDNSPISVTEFPAATYFLVLREESGSFTSFKIQKF